jgi:hypothetical protein
MYVARKEPKRDEKQKTKIEGKSPVGKEYGVNGRIIFK